MARVKNPQGAGFGKPPKGSGGSDSQRVQELEQRIKELEADCDGYLTTLQDYVDREEAVKTDKQQLEGALARQEAEWQAELGQRRAELDKQLDEERGSFLARLEAEEGEKRREYVAQQQAALEEKKAQVAAEAARIIADAQTAASGIIEQAEKQASAITGEASADRNAASKELSEASERAARAASEILETAKADAAKILADAQTDAQERRAQVDAEIVARRDEKLAQANTIVASAQAQADATIKSAAERAESIVRIRLGEVEAREKALDHREQQLQEREETVSKRETDLNKRAHQLDLTSGDLDARSQALDQLWTRCSPGRVSQLEQEKVVSESIREANEARIRQLAADNERLNRDLCDLRPLGDARSGQSILEELQSYKDRMRGFQDQLAQYPSLEEVEALRVEARDAERWREEARQWRMQYAELEAMASRKAISTRELEQTKAQADALRALNDELKRELDQHQKALEARTGQRFNELVLLDQAGPSVKPTSRPASTRAITLSSLVEHICNYAASRKPALFYTQQAVAAFLAAMPTTRLTILQGLSGTGKTSLPRVVAEAIGACYRRIPVQSGWRDRNELLGYDNEFLKRFRVSEFTKAVYEAGLPAQASTIWYITLDEINLARVEYYYADFLSILEETDPNEWLIPLIPGRPEDVSGKGPKYLVDEYKLRVPENLWFVGTANEDESTFEITDKVYDRAQVIEFRERQQGAPDEMGRSVEALPVSATELQRLFRVALDDPAGKLTDEERDSILLLDAELAERFQITFGNRILTQLEKFVPAYYAATGSREDAVDLQLARKVLRKLERRHDPDLKEGLETLKDIIKDVFPGWKMIESNKLIDRRLHQLGGGR